VLLELDIEERNRLIGKNLRKYRLLKGLTQDELAEGLCSVSQLSKVENGKTYVNRTLLRQMTDRLGVTVERVEAADALLEELTEQLQLAKDAKTAGNFEKAFELVREVVAKSREFGYANLLAESVILECRLLVKTAQYDAAIEVGNHALREEVAQDSTQRVQILCELGLAYQGSGNMIAAYDCYCRADDEMDQVDTKNDIRLMILFNLAKCHYFMHNYRTAVRYAEKVEKLAEEKSKFLYRIRATYMKAGYLVLLDRFEEAERYFMDALKEAEQNSLLLDVAIIHDNLGETFLKQREFGQSKAHLKRAQQILELLNEDLYLCASMALLAEVYMREGQYQFADEVIDKCVGILSTIQLNTYREKAKALKIRGLVRLAEDEFEGYVINLEQALELYDQNQVLIEAYDLAVELAEQLDQRGDSRALGMYRKAIEYNKKSIEFGMRR
jgi:HTH-type transcriptional regulator, quorum sensing regulator NprR